MNYIATDFHLHYISSYTLYIQSDIIHDSLVVLDEDHRVLVYLSYDNLAPSAEVIRVLSLPFEKVFINLIHQNLIWVPSDVYEESEKEMYLDYFADINIQDLHTKGVKEVGATGLYHFDMLSFNKWKSVFPNANIVPSFEPFLRQSTLNIDDSSELLAIQFYDNQVDVLLFVNAEMRLYNTFEVATADDLSYFVLSIMKNFAISGKIQKIAMSGAQLDSEWGQRLKAYTQVLIVLESSFKWKSDDADVSEVLKTLNTLQDIQVCV